MPKRPSSVIIAPDSQIISADKFGDVYSLPLLVTDSGQTGAPGTSSLSSFAKPAFKLSANTLTVHSKRNLIALEHQQRQMELNKQSKDAEAARGEAKEFELTLLLGHVSMLTDMLLVESEGRRYILTGDRDEHIRVSRYIPQAHVIEGYCLGHKEFVNSIILPATKEALLVSGGGDPDLFSWDWKTGKLLSKTSLLRLAQEIRPETTKVAVSGLATLLYPTESGDLSYVLAICERYGLVHSLLEYPIPDTIAVSKPSSHGRWTRTTASTTQGSSSCPATLSVSQSHRSTTPRRRSSWRSTPESPRWPRASTCSP